jgi:hypothetical protein
MTSGPSKTVKGMFATVRKYYQTTPLFSLFILEIIMLLYLFLEINNHRFWMNDFKVYYTASGRLLNGETLYQMAIDGHYHYKYSPPCALFFIPFRLFPFIVAKILYWILLSLLICTGFYIILRLFELEKGLLPPPRYNLLVFLTALIMSVHIERELHLGQVNNLLLVIFLAILYFSLHNRIVISALLWAASIFIKPFGLIFLPYFIIKKNYRILLYWLIFMTVFFLAPLIFYSPEAMAQEYHHWVEEIRIELANKEGLGGAGNHTIFSVLYRYTPFRLLQFSMQATFVFQLVILVAIGGMVFYLLLKGRKLGNARILEFSFLISLVPLLSFTSYNAFVAFELSVFLILLYFVKLPKGMKLAAIVGLILLGGNIHDLLGHSLWTTINNWSLVTIGAILILVCLVYLRIKEIA